jgi:hypothetical protein
LSDDPYRQDLSALAEVQAGPFHAHAEARATREGLVTFGVVMSGVLLSAALLVQAVRRPARRDQDQRRRLQWAQRGVSSPTLPSASPPAARGR